MYNTLLSAFEKYPKLISTFSEKSVHLAALEATIRYYATNTDSDIVFYKSLGFRTIGIAKSEKFGFVNTYLLYKSK